MSNSEIDHLFKKKMENLTVSPTNKAWEKLVTRKKGNSKLYYFSIGIAASITLLALFFWNAEYNSETFQVENPMALSDSNSYNPSELNNDNPITDNYDEIKSVSSEENFTDKNINDNNFSSNNTLYKVNITAKKENSSKINFDNIEIEIPDNKGEIHPLEDKITTEMIANNPTEIKPKLVYDLTELHNNPDKEQSISNDQEQKNEIKEEEEEEGEKRKVNLKKIIDFAKSIKTNETGIGTLREVKDNLVSPGRKTKNETESD